MSATIAFDTLKFVRRLREVGMDEKQAEAFSDALREVQDAQWQALATQEDIRDIKRDIKELAWRMAAEMAPLKWGIAVTAGGIIALILKTFFPH